MRLDGKSAIITGGGSGIGRAIALAFAREGADVAICGRRREPLEEVAGHVEKTGRNALVLEGDVSVLYDVERFVAETKTAWGGLDILVNNAAYYRTGPFEEADLSDLDRSLAVNVSGPVFMIQSCLPLFKERRGSIINISSSLAASPVPGTSFYTASKAALESLTRVLALEFAPAGIRVNAIAPAVVDTPLHQPDDREDWLKTMGRFHPLGRVGKPEDVAPLAVYLASGESDWMTGAILPLDGGIAAT